MARYNSKLPFDDILRDVYLEELEKVGQPRRCARAVGVSYSSVQAAVKNEPEFRDAYQDAMGLFSEAVEEEVRRRAMDGVEEPVFYKGESKETVNRKSDGLLTLLVKAKNSEFNDKIKAEVSIAGGLLVTSALPKTTEEWLAQQAIASQNQAQLNSPVKQLIDTPPQIIDVGDE